MIGALRHLLTLQEKVLTPDAGGGFAESWQNIGNDPVVHAEVLALDGSEVYEQRQVGALVRVRAVIRYRADITPVQRFLQDGVAYHIRHVADPDGTRRFLEIIAEKA